MLCIWLSHIIATSCMWQFSTWNMANAPKELVLKFDLVLEILNLNLNRHVAIGDSSSFPGEKRKAEIARTEVLGNLLLLPCRLTTIVIHLNYCHSGIILPFWESCSQVFIFLLMRFHLEMLRLIPYLWNFSGPCLFSQAIDTCFHCFWSFGWLVSFKFSSFAVWKDSLATYANCLVVLEKLKNIKIYSIAISTDWRFRKN